MTCLVLHKRSRFRDYLTSHRPPPYRAGEDLLVWGFVEVRVCLVVLKSMLQHYRIRTTNARPGWLPYLMLMSKQNGYWTNPMIVFFLYFVSARCEGWFPAWNETLNYRILLWIAFFKMRFSYLSHLKPNNLMKLALPLKWLPILKYIVIHRKNLSMYKIKKW